MHHQRAELGMARKMRLVVGLSGASGVVYGVRMLEALKRSGVETHLIVTPWAAKMLEYETEFTPKDLDDLADFRYDDQDMAAPISSGSFKHHGMAVIPCSMKTVAGIASGYSTTLLLRAADVTLKEGRRLVLVPRETPLSAIHLRNMLTLAEMGATILPAMPAFYHRPRSMDDLINHVVGKALDQFGVEHNLFKRWQPISEGHSGPKAVG